MHFAREELKKYGWREGQGLGKHEDGILKPLKPKLKFDNAGLGHDISEEFKNPWWQKVYDNAANSLLVKQDSNNIVLKTKRDESEEVSINRLKKKSRHKNKAEGNSSNYNGFIKLSELHGNYEKSLSGNMDEAFEFDTRQKKNCDIIPEVSSEELFQACGGRTVHKGARHGLRMNAKLARIEEQDKNIIKTIENSSNSIKKVAKKIKYNESECFKIKIFETTDERVLPIHEIKKAKPKVLKDVFPQSHY